MKEYAIIRIEKIKTRLGLVQRAQHNDRSKETPNADESRLGLNQEYVNVTGEPILALLDARIKEAGVGQPRANATICVEVLLTGGPNAEVWQRAPGTAQQLGQATDMRESQWAKDTINFAHAEWGKNLLSLKLHQDEKTPHFQAFVVPIVGAGGGRSGEANPHALNERLPDDTPARRSARDLFTPRRLAQLQTDFSEAMEPHGFKRGIAGSRAHHKTMGEMYGLLEKTATDIAPLLGPVGNEPFVLGSLPSNPLAWKKWLSETENRVNTTLDRIREEANAKLAVAGQVAVAAAGGNESAGRSREWVEKEKQHKTGLTTTVSILQLKLGMEESINLDLTRQLEQAKMTEAELIKNQSAKLDHLALHAVQGTLPVEIKSRGKEVWEGAKENALQAQVRALTLPLESEAMFYERMRNAGYSQGHAADGTPRLVDGRTGARFKDTVRPGGAEAHPLAEQIALAVQATELAKQARYQESRDRQLAAERDYEFQLHRRAELTALRDFSLNLSPRDNLTARVRVPSDAVASIVKQFGANIATADTKPGKDGTTGINLRYNPQVASQCVTIDTFLLRVASKGGEVYERPDAQETRQKVVASDRSRGTSYGLDKSQDIERD